jgi:predicted nucleic acid-binding protein
MRNAAEPLFIDANVPIHAAGTPHEYKVPCLDLMDALAAGKLHGVTSVEVLIEVVQHYARRRRHDLASFVADRLVLAVEHVIGVDLRDIQEMTELLLQSDQLPARDALHIAVMQRHGLTHIVTADRHFAAVPGITALDPIAAADLLEA